MRSSWQQTLLGVRFRCRGRRISDDYESNGVAVRFMPEGSSSKFCRLAHRCLFADNCTLPPPPPLPSPLPPQDPSSSAGYLDMMTCPKCSRLFDSRLSATPPPSHPVMTAAPQQWMQEECPSDAPEAEPTDEAMDEAVPPQSFKGFDLCDVGDRLLTYVWDCGSLYTKFFPRGTHVVEAYAVEA